MPCVELDCFCYQLENFGFEFCLLNQCSMLLLNIECHFWCSKCDVFVQFLDYSYQWELKLLNWFMLYSMLYVVVYASCKIVLQLIMWKVVTSVFWVLFYTLCAL